MLQDNYKEYNKSVFMLVALFGGLIGIFCAVLMQNYLFLLAIVALPLILLLFCSILKHAILMYFIAFSICYYATAFVRYTGIVGISYVVDCVVLFTIVFMLLVNNNIKELKEKSSNILLLSAIAWLIYSIFQLANHEAVAEAWMSSRGVALNGVMFTVLTLVSIRNFTQVKRLLFIMSIFTLTAVGKALMQKNFGWDPVEVKWLHDGAAKTHLIATGTRYFSFFSDAGNFGSNMGFATVLFSIVGLYSKSWTLRIYYIIVALLALLAMFLSGTRGAIVVPIVGFTAMVIFSRKSTLMIALGILLVATFVFFKFTYIGQSNQYIRRMRTVFVSGTEEASFNVRLLNQKLLADYLQNKPFGVGLGLSGVENQKFADILTTQIPHDSWMVKIWVETGIVGLLLYLLFIVGAISQAAKRLMFNVRDSMIKFYLLAWLCGICGLLVSSYGNAFFGQFPTNIIVFSGLMLAMNGEYFERKLRETGK